VACVSVAIYPLQNRHPLPSILGITEYLKLYIKQRTDVEAELKFLGGVVNIRRQDNAIDSLMQEREYNTWHHERGFGRYCIVS
jgi:hypothetical protein